MSRDSIVAILVLCGFVLGQSLWAQARGRRVQGRGRGQGGASPVLQAFDTDRDGVLSSSEIDASAAKLRERDANKDGKLSAEELAVRTPSGNRGGPVAMEGGSDLQKPPLPKDEAEKRILEAISQAQQGERYANVSESDGRLLRQLTEALGAKRVVELGTSTGESGLWFSLALRKTGGKLFTHDIDAGRIAVARENFKRAGVQELITIAEGDAHQTVPKNTDPIDILFVDAEKEGYDAYLRELLPLVRPGGLIIAHNMRRPAPNLRYIEAITTNPHLDTSFLLMDGAGIAVTLKKR